jgi:hypothetical protein
MDHPVLSAGREPYCRRAAWAWLIEYAAWRERWVDVGGKTIRLRRGQLAHSYRYMAQAWGWPVATVQRFINRLKTERMIGTEGGAGRLVITICNYERYQSLSEATGTASDTNGYTRAVRRRYGSGTKKKERKEGNSTVASQRLSAQPTSSGAAQPDILNKVIPSEHAETTPERVVKEWNRLAERYGLTKVIWPLNAKRRSSLGARMREAGGIAGFIAVIDLIPDSPFLLGANSRGWKANFDFVLQPTGFAKVREGTYSNQAKPPSAHTDPLAASWADIHTRRGRSAGPSFDIEASAEVIDE